MVSNRSRDHFETKMSHYLEWQDWSRDHFRDQNGLKPVSRPFWNQNVTLPRVTRLVSRPFSRLKWSQFQSRDRYRHQNIKLCVGSRHNRQLHTFHFPSLEDLFISLFPKRAVRKWKVPGPRLHGVNVVRKDQRINCQRSTFDVHETLGVYASKSLKMAINGECDDDDEPTMLVIQCWLDARSAGRFNTRMHHLRPVLIVRPAVNLPYEGWCNSRGDDIMVRCFFPFEE